LRQDIIWHKPVHGGGNYGTCARELGRNYVGIELNEDYVRLAEERLQEYAHLSKKG